jgi:hypothetical protein
MVHACPASIGAIGRAGDTLTVVVDQFEDLLECASPGIRTTFVTALAGLSRSGVAVVLGVRADCHTVLTGDPLLRSAINDAFIVGSMLDDGLRPRSCDPPSSRMWTVAEHWWTA